MKKLRFAEKTTCKDVKVIDLKVNALSSMMSGHWWLSLSHYHHPVNEPDNNEDRLAPAN